MSRKLEIGDLIVKDRVSDGTVFKQWRVMGYTSRGKLRMRPLHGPTTEVTTWWTKESSLPKHYRLDRCNG